MTTLLQEQARREITRTPIRHHVTEWVLGVIGALAAAVGAYLYYAPADWFLAGVAEAWYLGLFVGAGLFLATALGVLARKVFIEHQGWMIQSMVYTGLALLALAGAVFFAVIW
ncbi:MAG: hypothetical protein ACRDWH_08400, partial [Acidimicrobiia bacterium]